MAQVDTDQHDMTLSLQEFAIMDIERNTEVELSIDTPTEAGAPLNSGFETIDNSVWLNYTSAIANNSTQRNILVQLNSNINLNGIELRLQSANAQNGGAGDLGMPSGQILLSSSPQILISGIGGCYTGDGVNVGHQLTYTLNVEDYNSLTNQAETTFEVIFTITD